AIGAQEAFEAATIKPVEPNVPHSVGIKVYPGGRIVASTLSLKVLIAAAFRLSYWQISGGDAWVEQDEYNLEAKPAANLQPAITNLRHSLFGIEEERLRAMLQTLLVDRFQLKFHRQTKTGDVYILERSGKPLGLRPAEVAPPDSDATPQQSSFGSIGYVGGSWGLSSYSMAQLAKLASDYVLHLPGSDRTGLTGAFDYKQFTPDLEPNYSDHSESFRRLLAELGLKLERAKGSIETFVIDRASKPQPTERYSFCPS